MKALFLLFVLISMAFVHACAATNAPIYDEVKMDIDNCEQEFCITVTYTNEHIQPVCIKNTYFPYNGDLAENVFRVSRLKSKERAKYRLIEPSMVTTNKHAALVRLLAPGAIATTTIEVKNFYDLTEGEKYRFEFSARAFYCGQYGMEEASPIVLSGGVEGLVR